MKRRIFSLIICMVLALSACDAEEEKPDTVRAKDPSEMTMEELMIYNSLMGEGSNYRLKKVIEKARAGEDVTIGFIGGSITEGYNAGTQEIYAKRVYDFFSENYGTGENVHYVNAGLSGTPSSLGLLRSDRDLFAEQPDLIFIEFAVNDSNSSLDVTGYESLVYKALSQENEPAVILLMSVIETGYTCQDEMNTTGFRYDLTRISVKNAIWSYIEDGSITWDDWSNDESHPNEWGHSMYASFIIDYLKTVDASEIDKEYVLNKNFGVKGFDHTALKMIDRSMNMDLISIESTGSFEETGDLASFNEGWKYTGKNAENNSFTFTYTGKALYLVYKDTNNSTYGSAEIYVDGELVKTLYGNSSDGWNNPVIDMVVREKESVAHKVEIRMSADSVDKAFSILALGVVE